MEHVLKWTEHREIDRGQFFVVLNGDLLAAQDQKKLFFYKCFWKLIYNFVFHIIIDFTRQIKL